MTPLTTYHPPVTEASNDATVIYMWLSGKSQSTIGIYTRAANQFIEYLNKPLVKVVLEDLVAWVDSLKLRGYSDNSQALKISIIKSLFSYCWKIGYLPVNISKALITPSSTSALHERILEQPEVKELIEAATVGRDRCLLTLIYLTGLRVSEALGIDWKDLKSRASGGQVTVIGKGRKIRTVLISQALWEQLQALPRY